MSDQYCTFVHLCFVYWVLFCFVLSSDIKRLLSCWLNRELMSPSRETLVAEPLTLVPSQVSIQSKTPPLNVKEHSWIRNVSLACAIQLPLTKVWLSSDNSFHHFCVCPSGNTDIVRLLASVSMQFPSTPKSCKYLWFVTIKIPLFWGIYNLTCYCDPVVQWIEHPAGV